MVTFTPRPRHRHHDKNTVQPKILRIGPPGGGFGNTAEPSRELSVGDVVAVAADGEVRLAVAKIGWTPVPGPLTEVRTSEHGTRPLPLPGSAPGKAGARQGGPR